MFALSDAWSYCPRDGKRRKSNVSANLNIIDVHMKSSFYNINEPREKLIPADTIIN